MGEKIDIPSLDGQAKVPAYLARPSGPPIAAVIVIQEIFGVNAGIRRKVDDWAAKGYLAIAPDMFWRFAPAYDVDPDVPAQLDQAMAQLGLLDLNLAIADIEASLRYAREILPNKKAGIVGFCWGGSVAYLAAARTDADASVGYYGRQIAEYLNEHHAIARPLMLHFGEADPSIPPPMRDQVYAALESFWI